MIRALALSSFLAVVLASKASADPCRAIPDDGTMPGYLRPGFTFSGQVVRILDGDSLCVEHGPGGPTNWVEVRLADFYAPEASAAGGMAAKSALEGIALGKDVVCLAGARTYDRVAARCTISGTSIGALMRRAGVREGGNGTQSARRRTPTIVTSHPGADLGGVGVFRSCAQARAAGVAPLRRGEPGYNPALDGDGDGVACEPYRGR